MEGYFQEPISSPLNPIRVNYLHDPSHPPGPGLLTWFPSTTPFGLALGVGLPCSDSRSAGPLGLSAGEFLTLLIVTHVSILTSDTSSVTRVTPSQAYGTLRYRAINSTRSFGTLLDPRYIFGTEHLN